MDIDLNDEIIKGLTVIHNGKIVFSQNSGSAPPPPNQNQNQNQPKKDEKKEHIELKVTDEVS